MSCQQKLRYEPIDDRIVDHGTILYPRHNVFTFMGCVLARSGMGLLLLQPKLSQRIRHTIIVIMVVALIIFFVKYVNNVAHDTLNWKNYPLMLISYSIALYLISIHKESEAGMLVIADALAGLHLDMMSAW